MVLPDDALIEAQRIFDAAHVPHVDSTGGDYEGYCENDYQGCPLRDSMSEAIAALLRDRPRPPDSATSGVAD